MKHWYFFLLLIFVQFVRGNSVSAQGRVPLTADSVALYQRHIGQLPGVYRYFQHFAGDLNNDKRPDVVVIAQNIQHRPEDAPGGFSRRVILLLYQPNGQMRTAVYNDQILRCSTCGGGSMQDPFNKVVFNGNLLSFVSTYGFGEKISQVITFAFDPKRPDWWLHSITLQPLTYDATGALTKTKPAKTLGVRELGDVRFQDFTSKLIPKK